MSGEIDPMDAYFRDQFNTKLSAGDEKSFRSWAKKSKRDPDLETIDYDLRGFWKSNGKFADNGHAADTYKKPNHPTFSDQSMYHGTADKLGGSFVGGTWAEGNGRMQFRPSVRMLETTHDPRWLQGYMQEREPNVELILP